MDPLERIRQQVASAVDNENRVGQLTARLAAGAARGGAPVEQVIALVRAYVELVPDVLQSTQMLARRPGFANVGVLVKAAEEGFASHAPSSADLGTLLAPSYLVHQMLPQPGWEDTHRLVRSLLPPEIAADLDRQAAADAATRPEAQPATPGRPAAAAPVAAKPTGRCEDCAHVRHGASIARNSFNAVLETLRPRIQSSYNQKTQEERQTSSQFFDERQNLQQFGNLEYTRRPTVATLQYCGLDEMNGRYYCCEVKNLDPPCGDFTPVRQVPASHTCTSCEHHFQPPAKLIQVVEEITGSGPQAQQVREQIRQSLQYQADTEFQSCVDGDGIVATKPGMVPFCEALSSAEGEGAPRYIVGPVVNVASRCAHWSGGTNAARRDLLAHVDALVVRARHAVREREAPSVMSAGADFEAGIRQRQSAAANAQADVIESCLLALAVDRDFAESMGNQLASDVWFSERIRSDDAAGAASSPAAAAPAAAGQPQQFEIAINSSYRHPAHDDLTLMIYQYPPWFVAQVDRTFAGRPELFDLSRFQPGVWIQLVGSTGPLPIALAIVGPPENRFLGAWL